jgi:hypothetical protein
MAAAPDAGFDSEWLDTMVKRLITELEKQLAAISGAAAEQSTPQSRAADARTLAMLERTLEKLAKLERERAVVREKKIARHDTEGRAALERRLDKRLAARGQKGASGQPGG